MKPNDDELLTVGKLREWLKPFDDDSKLIFGCQSLRFYRVKDRGTVVQIEFAQPVSDDEDGNVFVLNPKHR